MLRRPPEALGRLGLVLRGAVGSEPPSAVTAGNKGVLKGTASSGVLRVGTVGWGNIGSGRDPRGAVTGLSDVVGWTQVVPISLWEAIRPPSTSSSPEPTLRALCCPQARGLDP